MNTRSLLVSAAIAGALTALLSSIPLLNMVNCLVCGWLWIGGIFAVWMYRKNAGVLPDSGGGAMVGALAGLVGAIVASMLSAVLTMVGVGVSAIPAEAVGQIRDVFGELAEVLVSGTATLFVGLVINLVLYPIFGAIGGLLGVAVFKGR